jgi:hypothetical protein
LNQVESRLLTEEKIKLIESSKKEMIRDLRDNTPIVKKEKKIKDPNTI